VCRWISTLNFYRNRNNCNDCPVIQSTAEIISATKYRTALVLQVNCTAVDGEWRLVLDPTAPGFHYDTLGRIIRSNVVRGTDETYDCGVTQSDFNESVFSDRHHQHQPQQGVELQANQYHKQRDDLSTFYSRCFLSFQYYHFTGFNSKIHIISVV